jgi:hypothetical protein
MKIAKIRTSCSKSFRGISYELCVHRICILTRSTYLCDHKLIVRVAALREAGCLAAQRYSLSVFQITDLRRTIEVSCWLTLYSYFHLYYTFSILPSKTTIRLCHSLPLYLASSQLLSISARSCSGDALQEFGSASFRYWKQCGKSRENSSKGIKKETRKKRGERGEVQQ